MNATLNKLISSAEHALAITYKNARAVSLKTKKQFLKAIQVANKTIKAIVSAPMAVRLAAFAWAFSNYAYTTIVAVTGGAIQALTDWAIAGAKAVTNALITPLSITYKVINKIQKSITKKDLPKLIAHAKVNATFDRANQATDRFFETTIRSVMHWYPRMVYFAASTLVAASFIANSLTGGAAAAWLTAHGLTTAALFLNPGFVILFGVIVWLTAVATAVLNKNFRTMPAITWQDTKRLVSGNARRFSEAFSIRNAREEIEVLRSENVQLRSDLARAIKAAQDFKKAFDMSMKPGKKGGPRLARP